MGVCLGHERAADGREVLASWEAFNAGVILRGNRLPGFYFDNWMGQQKQKLSGDRGQENKDQGDKGAD